MRDQSHGQLLPAASTRAIERRNNLASERFGRGKRFHPIETKAVSDSFQSKQTQHIYIYMYEKGDKGLFVDFIISTLL